MSTKNVALAIGKRNYRIKKDSLRKLEQSSTTSNFEKHLVQEGVKQILFANGSEEIMIDGGMFRMVPKEMIRFLLDHDIIEEYNFETEA